MPHVPTTDTGPLDPTPDLLVSRTAQFQTNWPRESTALVSASGELDAANGSEFVDYALRQTDRTTRLVLDLSELTFFATAGFTALHTLNVQCVGQEIRWALASGPAVERVLRICDPDATLPVCADVEEALGAVEAELPRLLHLVPESR
ncbi:MAG: STAS domain-containing protein [Actinomycetota bacterium]|nr:STAS domain-containing protein [Actinomycetota bacterium]